MTIYNQNLTSANYLLKLDKINKYNLNNTFSYPKIDSIKLRINSEDLVNASNSLNPKDKMNNLLFRAYIILYIITGFFPKLKVTHKKSANQSLNNVENDNYIFEITLNKSEQINSFLQKLLVETSFFKENLNNETIQNICIQNGYKCSLNTKIFLNQFFEINELVFAHFNDFNTEKLVLHTNFIFGNFKQFNKFNFFTQGGFLFTLI